MKTYGMLVIGVGGQGIILASDIIGETAMKAGFDVKKTDTIGMAQRGGSVVSHIRIGEKVWSPLIREGEVDLILAFEKLEAARWVNHLNQSSVVIINNYAQPPLAVNLGHEKYPDDDQVRSYFKNRASRLFFVEGNTEAARAGDSRSLNTYMLGCASRFLPIPVNFWEGTIEQRFPDKLKAINMTAFEAGRKEVE